VIGCERDHLVFSGNDGGLLRARGVGLSRPAARERSGRATDAGRLPPLP
jgi:hypothetical protein